jgi:hypothetical protein
VIYKDVDMEIMGKLKVHILFHLVAWGYAGAATIIPYAEEYLSTIINLVFDFYYFILFYFIFIVNILFIYFDLFY